METTASAEVPIRHNKGPPVEDPDVFQSTVRAKFYGSPCRPKKKSLDLSVTEQACYPSPKVGFLEDILPAREGGSGSASSKAGGMYQPPTITPVKMKSDGTPMVELMQPKKLVDADDILLNTMLSETYRPALRQLFDQYRSYQEIRPAPGLSSKKILIMMRDSNMIDLRISKGVISVILRESSSKDIHLKESPMHGSGAGSGMGQIMLKFRQFLIFIALLSVKKFAEEDPIRALELTLEQHLLPLIEEEDRRKFKADPMALDVLKENHEMLVALFSHYCAKEQDELEAKLGVAYQAPERMFRLGLDGVQMFGSDMKIARKLLSQEALTVTFDDIMLGSGESSMRFPEFVQWLCLVAKGCFDTPAFSKLKTPADHASALIKVVESSHETALVMHARGQVHNKYTSFKEWENSKLGHRARQPAVSNEEHDRFIQAMDEEGVTNALVAAFKYYCATTNLSSNPQCEFLSQQGFVRLCKEANLLDNKLTRPMAEVVFMDHVVAVHKKLEAEDVRKSKNSLAHEVNRSNMPKHVHMMTFDYFLKALTSCANLKFGVGQGLVRHMEDPVACLMKVVNEYIVANCTERMEVLLEGGDLFHSQEIRALLDVYEEPLKALFVAYCTIDARSCPRWHAADAESSAGHGYGLSFFQLWEMMKDFELACCREGVQPQITRNQVTYVFLCANRVGLTADDKQEVVNFQEFKEILGRIAVYFLPEDQREDITPALLATAIQAVFARMDASPGMMKITLHYGGTHTGKIRLVPDPTRRPHGWQEDVIQHEALHVRTTTPAGYTRQGVRALHEDAYPSDGTAPRYVHDALRMKPGSPPWRGNPGDEMEAYAYSPTSFAFSVAASPSAEPVASIDVEAE